MLGLLVRRVRVNDHGDSPVEPLAAWARYRFLPSSEFIPEHNLDVRHIPELRHVSDWLSPSGD